MADALQINCALWGMLACAEIEVVRWIELIL